MGPLSSTEYSFFVYFFGGQECVCHSFAYVAHLVFLGDVWIRTQRAAVASRCATQNIDILFLPSGEMEGERVARGDKAGEKEGDMAACDNSSCDIGDLHSGLAL
jgi:hypothetical protein